MADILWSDAVGSSTVADGGYVGDLLTLARAHVEAAITSNELTQAEAGAIYTAMIPAAMQHGIGFVMQEELTEAKIDEATAAADIRLVELELANAKLVAERNKAEAELEKHWGYDVTRDEDGELVMGDSTGEGKIDEEVDLLQTQDYETAANGEADRELTAHKSTLTEQQGFTEVQQTALTGNQASKVIEETKVVTQQELTEHEQTALVHNQGAKVLTEDGLVAEQTVTEGFKGILVNNQGFTEVRKKQSYDDNMLMEMVKQQGGLASFAVNADSSDAQTPIDNLITMINSVYERADNVDGTQEAIINTEEV